MATTGEVYPTVGTTVSEAPWSAEAWLTPGNIVSDNGVPATITAATYDSPDQSQVLKATGFNFSSIPYGSTIDGVICRINAWAPAGTASLDLAQLLNASGAKVGTNQYATPVAVNATTTVVYTKGSSTDKWGNSLTDVWVKDPDFGVALGMAATSANADVSIDYVTLEVYYTPPSIPKAHTVTEDWSSGTITDNGWAVESGGTASIVNQQLSVPVGVYPKTTVHYTTVIDLSDSHASVAFISIPAAQTDTGSEWGYRSSLVSPWPGIVFALSNGVLTFREISDSGATSDTTLTYDPVAHKHKRVRVSADGQTIYWDTSPDGTTWTNRRNKVKVANLTVVSGYLYHWSGTWGSGTGTTVFDNVNTPDETLTSVTDSWQTSWNVVGQVLDTWQTSWNDNATISDSWQTSWDDLFAISDSWQTSWGVLGSISDAWQTSWNVEGLTNVTDSWQTSWTSKQTIADAWQTSWNVAITTLTWNNADAWNSADAWSSHTVLTNVTDSWQTSWNARASINDTWQTSWNTNATISDSWATSWGIKASITDTWITSWGVRASINDTWQNSWNISSTINDSWQTSWGVKGSISDSWQSSWNINVSINDSWQTSWNVLETIAPTSVSDAWQTSWGVRASIVDSWQSTWNINVNILDSWATSWFVNKEVSDVWQTSWGIKASIIDSWQTIWKLASDLPPWSIILRAGTAYTEFTVSDGVWTKLNTGSNAYTPVDSPVGSFDEVDKPTTNWTEV